jgi:Xaa-Pro aminopeptidase
MKELYLEKSAQALAVLQELDVDLWVLLGRETGDICDPALRLVLPINVMGTSAFLFSRTGRQVAIVRAQDVAGVEATGIFPEVVGYPEDWGALVRQVIEEIAPRQIALNYDLDDPLLDGVTYGMVKRLELALEGSVYRDRIVSGRDVVKAVRGRKTTAEIALMQTNVAFVHRFCGEVTPRLLPGVTERQVFDWCRTYMAQHSLTGSWDEHACPLVHAGIRAKHGMVTPGDNPIQPGDAFHLSWGVRQNGYAIDCQRTWYVPNPEDWQDGICIVPDEVQNAFDTIVNSIDAARAAMRPGIAGWEIDKIARDSVMAAGYPNYARGSGHTVGRALHDGGIALAPKGIRYGAMTELPLDAGFVSTLELFLNTSRGVVAVEEMVQVTPDGGVFLAPAQRELWIAGGDR